MVASGWCFLLMIFFIVNILIQFPMKNWNEFPRLGLVETSSGNGFALNVLLSQQNWWWPGPCLNIKKTSFPSMEIPMIKIRRPWDRLIFNMGIHILVWRHLYIETAPWWSFRIYIDVLLLWFNTFKEKYGFYCHTWSMDLEALFSMGFFFMSMHIALKYIYFWYYR